jgi:serine O-acetyltransferase
MREALILYLIPVAILVAAWLFVSAVIFVRIRLGSDFAFGRDVTRKFDDKRGLPSAPPRFSFLYIAKVMLGDSCIQAAFLYRVSHYLAVHRLRTLAEIVYAFSRFATHADLSPGAEIGPGIYLYHGIGTVVGKGARIGERVLLCHGVSIGGGAVLGDDVKVWAGAQVLAKVRLGDRTEVGANAVVIGDFPADSILFGVPARKTGTKEPSPLPPEPEATVGA